MSKLVTKNNDGVTAESFTNSYGTCAVFTKANESGGTDTWCLYAKDPQNTKNWYIFMGETASSRSSPARWTCCCRCT